MVFPYSQDVCIYKKAPVVCGDAIAEKQYDFNIIIFSTFQYLCSLNLCSLEFGFSVSVNSSHTTSLFTDI